MLLFLLPQSALNQIINLASLCTNYRYGFNGMEKDDEVKGDGNSYDFGARMYDSRLGRWLSLDPHAQSYPELSPYSFVANSPLVMVDPDGKDNVIYLVLLPSARAKLSPSDIRKVVEEANKIYEEMGVNTRVVLFDESKYGEFDEANIDHNDSYALVGSVAEMLSYGERHPNSVNSSVKNLNSDNPEISTMGKVPQGASQGVTGQGIYIDLNYNNIFAAKRFKMKQNKGLAWSIVHGSTHNSGLNHDTEGIAASGSRQAGILAPENWPKGGGGVDEMGKFTVNDIPGTPQDIINATIDTKITKEYNVKTFGKGEGNGGAVAKDNYGKNVENNNIHKTNLERRDSLQKSNSK